jgi:acetyltransferase-like isoleucine patch superfamily enzyme
VRLQNSVVIAPGWEVGDEADVGPGVLTTTERWHPGDSDDRPRGGRIGANTRIGAGVVLMPGVEIGDGAVVGAGAVVRESVPPGATAVGMPARLLPRA